MTKSASPALTLADRLHSIGCDTRFAILANDRDSLQAVWNECQKGTDLLELLDNAAHSRVKDGVFELGSTQVLLAFGLARAAVAAAKMNLKSGAPSQTWELAAEALAGPFDAPENAQAFAASKLRNAAREAGTYPLRSALKSASLALGASIAYRTQEDLGVLPLADLVLQCAFHSVIHFPGAPLDSAATFGLSEAAELLLANRIRAILPTVPAAVEAAVYLS